MPAATCPTLRLSLAEIARFAGAGPEASPLVTGFSWGRLDIGGRPFKDVKLFPGGSRAWDWGETGTRHVPGVQVGDALELIDRGADLIILSQGVDEVLRVPEGTVEALRARGVEVRVAPTVAAIALYNSLCASRRVGALLHSTC